jgi:hypothetical protein
MSAIFLGLAIGVALISDFSWSQNFSYAMSDIRLLD